VAGISIKGPAEVAKMREAGRLVARVLEALAARIEPGLPTGERDAEARRITAEAGAEPLFLGVPCPAQGGGPPFPAAICCSVNEQVVHGIPSAGRRIAEGDIVSIDFGVRLNGWCGDAAVTVPCGAVSLDVQRLLDATQAALQVAIAECREGRLWSQVAGAIEATAHAAGLSVVEKYVGHGIGSAMHEPPQLPNFVNRRLKRHDTFLRSGMTLAIEPMLNLGTKETDVLADRWTVVTRDRRPSAHFEHTVVVEADGARPLTLL
jgi:methionyl aminopeptidase